jgi:subtilisin family serine protease
MSKRRVELLEVAAHGKDSLGRRVSRSIAMAIVVSCAMAIGVATAVATPPSPVPSGLGSTAFTGPLPAGAGPAGPARAAEASPALKAAADAATRVPGHYIVVLEDAVAHPGAVAEAQTERRDGELGLVFRHALKGYSAELSKSAVEALRNDPRVNYIAPDRKVSVNSQTIPTGVSRIGAPSRTDLKINDLDDYRVNADVAVIDTGVDPTHPDLDVYKRTDCIPTEEVVKCVDNSGTDGYGHGTHVAGIVGAVDNNFGVVGVAPGARIWAVKVLEDKGFGNESWIVAGVDWVTAHAGSIDVANMSLGCECEQPVLEEAITNSVEAGVVYVVAAGNEAIRASEISPARNPDAITVGALADSDGKAGGEGPTSCFEDRSGNMRPLTDDTLASFSNWGPAVDVVAPGVCIRSAVPLGGSLLSSSPSAEYASVSGTSMAAPHVAGAAAILAAGSNPESKEDVEAIGQQIAEEGSYNWQDTSLDRIHKPLLDLGPAKTEAVTTDGDGLDHGVSFNAVVKPGGLETSYRFEYGPTTGYGLSVPASPKSVGAGSKSVKVSETLTGLKVEPLHYRVVVTNSNGTVYGKDRVVSPRRWSVQSTPGAAGAEGSNSAFTDVSCRTSECTAVGVREVLPGNDVYPYVKRWSEGSWTTVAAPLEGEPRGVSCTTSYECVAVGNSRTLSPNIEAWQWQATKWVRMTVPMPAEAAHGTFESVDCVTWTKCVAVGWYVDKSDEQKSLIANWDGTKWTIQTPPAPAESFMNSLSDVSCNSSISCMAIGRKHDGWNAFVIRWDGTSWTEESVIFPGASGWFEAVSCARWATSCTAVGTSIGGNAWENAVGSWDGKSWSLESPGDLGVLTQLSCSSDETCMAAGYDYSGVIARHWNGQEWSLADLTRSTSSPEYELMGLSCSAAYQCTTVGFRRGASTDFQPMAQRSTPPPSASTLAATELTTSEAVLNGTVNPNGFATTYQIEYGPTTAYGSTVPTSPKSVGSGTSAVSVTQAVSGLGEGSYHFRVVASSSEGTTYSGDREFSTTKWKSQTGAGPGELLMTTLYDVSCASKEACMAVGDGETEVGVMRTAESWDGTTWTRHSVVPAPTESEYTYSVLQDVSCFTANECMATGFYSDEYSDGAVSDTWDGTSWTWQPVPLPSGSHQAGMTGVSCPAKEVCFGAGYYQSGLNGPLLPMLEVWDGTEWSIQAFTAPSGMVRGRFSAISCSAATACVAIGQYGKAGGGESEAMAARWNGSTWSLINNGLDGLSGLLVDISCTSASACKAVGGRIADWNGSSWSPVATPTPPNLNRAGLSGISCSSAESCTAVGNYRSKAGEDRVFADVWNGSTWSVDAMNQPPGGSHNSGVSAVSCTAANTCTAVGRSIGVESGEMIQRRLP